MAFDETALPVLANGEIGISKYNIIPC